MLKAVVHHLIVSTFGEDAMRHALFGPILHSIGHIAEGCGLLILTFVGIEGASATGVDPSAPTTPIGGSGLPSIGPQNFLSLSGLLYWLVLGGGAVWAIQRFSELVGSVIKAGRSGWITAAAGTDHQRAADCESMRAADRVTIANLRNDLNSSMLLVREKDVQIRSNLEQISQKDQWLKAKDDRIHEMSEKLMALSLSVSHNNGELIRAASAPRASSDGIPIPVTLSPTSVPVPVHEVGEGI